MATERWGVGRISYRSPSPRPPGSLAPHQLHLRHLPFVEALPVRDVACRRAGSNTSENIPAFEHYLDRAIAAGEVSLPLSRGLVDLVELGDDHLISALHAVRANGGPWSRRILDRGPAKLVLRERLGLDAQENLLSDALHDGLKAAGCEVFRRHSRQVFTKLAAAANPDGIADCL